MNVADYLLGDLALSVTLLPWVPASVRLSRRLLPGSDAAVAALSSSVIGIGGVIVVAELVGACDGFRRWPLAIVSALVAALVAKLGRPGDGLRRRAAGLPAGRAARAMLACTAVCILATTAALIGRDASVLTTGPHDLDSLHYHLTQAAQIVESHNIDRIHHTASSDGT
ncbi:MAG TPA: hypothetical protein VHB69_06820, partial [Mycobacteriales bacterium]|nr:hypothetical protein [Mycobacteriales bacterium]